MKKMLCIALVGLVSVYVHAADDTMNGQLNPIATAEADSSNMAQAGLALVPMLTQNLGVTEAQAAGGMGSIFQAVQGVMSTSDFNSLSKAVPNMDSLLSAAPAVETSKKSGGSLLSGAMDAAAQYGANTKTGAQLLSQFKSLGLSPDMVSKFTDVAMSYLKNGEVPQTAELLSTALSSVLK
ncbi:MAG TPA: DUF2780 domain-containing protein [Cellvibrio sp.]|nr:DUF2780 domain-containing protein [Cellvibrio sp.]